MNNLHRELAPITGEAWSQIEEEATRTFKRNIAGRRVVDVSGPHGFDFSARNLGRVTAIDSPDDGVQARQRVIQPVIELRVPFTLQRAELDDIARGADDADFDNLKDAAQKIAFAEDRAIFESYAAAAITGIREASSNPPSPSRAMSSTFPMPSRMPSPACVWPACRARTRWCSAPSCTPRSARPPITVTRSGPTSSG